MPQGTPLQVKMYEEDVRKVRAWLADIENAAPKVIKRAIDKTMSSVKTTVSRVGRETLNVYKRDLDKNIGVTKYDNAKASGCVTIIGESLPIFDFNPVTVATGVKVRIKKKRPAKIIEGAFIAKMKSGHQGVFWREWHEFRRPNIAQKRPWNKMNKKYRLKIHELFTTALPEAVGDRMPMNEILADAEKKLHYNLEHELDYELSKLK